VARRQRLQRLYVVWQKERAMMGWYRVVFAIDNQLLRPIELAAHNAQDACFCAGVAAGLAGLDEDDGEASLRLVECIETPAYAVARQRVKATACVGVREMLAGLTQVDGDADVTP
jgi:hypothetical protein